MNTARSSSGRTVGRTLHAGSIPALAIALLLLLGLCGCDTGNYIAEVTTGTLSCSDRFLNDRRCMVCLSAKHTEVAMMSCDWSKP